jgi:actin-like ATPase involved in cell morphogenesis
MNTNIRTLSEEIRKMVEKRIRLEILKDRETRLKKEITAVQNEIKRLEMAIRLRRIERKPKVTKIRLRRTGKSAKAMLVEVFKRTKRPMKVKELTRRLLQRGFRTARKDPSMTVDSALRVNPKLFRKIAPGTFELIS